MSKTKLYGWMSDSMDLNGVTPESRKVDITRVVYNENGHPTLFYTKEGPKYVSEIRIPDHLKHLLTLPEK